MWVGFSAQPAIIVAGSEDGRHTVVDVADQLVAGDGDDGEGSQPLTGARVLPILPKASQTERRAVLHPDRVGLLAALGRLPFEEAIDWNDAASESVGVAKRRLEGDRLRFGIDRLPAALRILAAVGNESPLEEVEGSSCGSPL